MFSKVIDKNYRDSLCFHKKVLKNIYVLKNTQNQEPGPGMSRHTCSQHWVLGHGVRVSQFLSLIVFKISKSNERVF